MKLLIASDLHGSARWAGVLRELFIQHSPDRLVLLGDLLYHGPRNPMPDEYDPNRVIDILNEMKHYILAVRGNCDAEVDQMVLNFPILSDSALLFVDGHLVFCTHGHVQGPQNMPYLRGGDVLLCGHTHIGTEQPMGRFAYLNPGSLALPKDGHHSYMVYEEGVFVRMNEKGETLGSWSLAQQEEENPF